ncbi:hypothetical protein DL765_005699 [Monosporascus sp. GIB2]|nr:hypothetical protein DL765_005699 [Monosporascus sp. GIB2]
MGLFSRSSAPKKDQAASEPKEDCNEGLEKYTGKSGTELEKWAETTPSVGKSQVSIAAGSSPGIGGELAAQGGPLGTNKPRDFSR